MGDPVTATIMAFSTLAAKNEGDRAKFKMQLDGQRFREQNRPIAPPKPETLKEPALPQPSERKYDPLRGRAGTLMTGGLGLTGQGAGYRKTLLGQ